MSLCCSPLSTLNSDKRLTSNLLRNLYNFATLGLPWDRTTLRVLKPFFMRYGPGPRHNFWIFRGPRDYFSNISGKSRSISQAFLVKPICRERRFHFSLGCHIPGEEGRDFVIPIVFGRLDVRLIRSTSLHITWLWKITLRTVYYRLMITVLR